LAQQKPFFSVVIPLYNKGPHIARSINSVLSHTFRDIELIIVNDASADNSLEEVAKFSGPRISLYHREKPGPGDYAARNLGIEKAKAEWIAFLDADDEWMPRHLESYFEFIDTHADINMFGCGWRYEQKGIISTDRYYNAHKQKLTLLFLRQPSKWHRHTCRMGVVEYPQQSGLPLLHLLP